MLGLGSVFGDAEACRLVAEIRDDERYLLGEAQAQQEVPDTDFVIGIYGSFVGTRYDQS